MRALRLRRIWTAIVILILPLVLNLPASKADTSPATLTDRCHDYKDRNTNETNAVVGQDQIVFDLCAAALVIKGTGSADPQAELKRITAAGPAIRKRFQGIAQEGRIRAACPTPRQSSTPEDDLNYLFDREYGCGPFKPKKRETALLSRHMVDVTSACVNYTRGRPAFSPRGMHGPITVAQLNFDTCRAADLIAALPKMAPRAINEAAADVLQKLNYEAFEFVHCHYSSHPPIIPTSDPDYTLHENPGCGQYEAGIGS